MPAARYELPGGRVILATVPLSDGLPKSQLQELVGVRLYLKNESDSVPWQIDVHEQLAQFVGQSQPVKAAVVKNHQNSDVVVVTKGHRETIDLFFPVPPQEAPEVPPPAQLSVTWRILVGAEPFVHQTDMFRARLAAVAGLRSDYGQTMGELWFNPAWNLPTPFYPPLTVEWHVVGPVRPTP
jgi:hypothetical protein